MTIHTKWMELMRQEAPDAFQDRPPGGNRAQASFIDGQIKLMKADVIQTWAHFLYSQFTSIINRHFREYGCRTVVLAFDDKRYVPRAKAITQLKRRAGVEIIDFGENDVLPNEIPAWKEAIMNPHFKNKVIRLVCDSVPHLVQGTAEGCRLVIDWQTIEIYEYDAEGLIVSSVPEPASAIGEADIKFPYWMRRLQTPMLIEATDGDYIPISLGLKVVGVDHPVSILKGRRGDRLEFIDIDILHACLKTALFRASRGKGHGRCWEIRLFVVLLGLSGTDFTRNLPLVSPVKIWECLPVVAQTFASAGGDDNAIDQARGKRIIELLYAEVYPKHIDPFSRVSIWHQAQASKLGARNKALIPTDARIRCTVRNLNFLMEYWLAFRAPEHIQDYGFRVSSAGTVEWDD